MTAFFRAVLTTLILGGLALADMSAAPARAQDTNAGPSTDGPTAMPATQTPASPAAQLLSNAINARIKYLHDRLRITAEQETLWAKVADAIGENMRDVAPLLRERFRSSTSGSALDLLRAHEMLDKVQLDSIERFTTVFDPLYAGLSPGQQKIADALIREVSVNTMIGGVPKFPAVIGLPLAYGFPIAPELPLLRHRFGRFEHLHGLISPGRPAIAGGHLGGFHR
jgi:periplasmic protein CpxP/Spy